jgi:hypothetical protein
MLYTPRDRRSAPFSELRDRGETEVGDWSFIDEKRRSVVKLRTRGFPFGMKMRRTVEGLCADITRGEEYSDDIFERIHDDDDDVFAKLAEALEGKGALDGAGAGIRQRWRPNQMAVGVFHALNGRPSLARELMQPYGDDFIAVSLMTSLYAFGQAVIGEAEGAPDYEIEAWLERAIERHPKSKRILNYLARRGWAVSDDLDMSRPRPFPLNYWLLERDPLEATDVLARPFVGLRETLSGLRHDEFLIVILLAGYRGNSYYVTLLDQLIQMRRLVGRHFPAAHVITSHERGGEHHDEWLDGERRARQCGFPLKVLYDPEDFVATMLDITGSPTAVIVDKRGKIVYQGNFTDDEGYWTALASLPNRQRSPSVAPTRELMMEGVL